MTKTALLALALGLLASTADAGQWVNGYVRKDGNYVQGYARSNPDRYQSNNYGYKGNTNPYTGQTGTQNYRQPRNGSLYGGGTIGCPNNSWC